MIIPIDRIPWEGLEVCGQLPAAALALEDEAELLRPLGPVECRLFVRIVSREVLVRGGLSLEVEFVCSRCGQPFRTTVRAPAFEELYAFSDPHATLDLTCDLRDSIILAFPSFPLCSGSCKGLCAYCGANRNRTACECREAPGDLSWSALDGLARRPDGVRRI